MELILNFAWALVAVTMLYAWLIVAPFSARERRGQFVALAVVILILLPAISMTDDLLAAQSPAEVVTSVRRDHDETPGASGMAQHALAMPCQVYAGLPLAVAYFPATDPFFSAVPETAARGPIQNRPPPAV